MCVKYGMVIAMSEASLPSAHDALASLRANGNQFKTVPLAPRPMGGVTFLHPRNGERPVAADPRVLAATGQFYIANEVLRHAVHRAGGRTNSLRAAAEFMSQLFAQPRLIWGVSGFATIGYPCGLQADQLTALYRYLAVDRRRPVLVCDGAAGAGVLGISGVLAAECGIQTLGVTPLQGMSTMAPRDHMLVYGDTYQQREAIVGLLPDILVIVGGGVGAQREGVATLNSGGRVLLIDDLVNSSIPWPTVPEMALAVREKRMLICGKLDEIPTYAERLRVAARKLAPTFRPNRLVALRRRFGA